MRPYPGRVIFDHLAKTGGQAVNAWLTAELGTGCVSGPVNGEHRDVIRHFGGAYSVITGHIAFNEGDTLDPRYDYVTLLREPVDRVVSWIYYLLHDVEPGAATRPLIEGARTFLATDGRESTPEFELSISNLATEHFRTASGRSDTGTAGLAAALDVLSRYRVVGIYERLGEFAAAFADLLGVARPPSLPRINITSSRPRVDAIPDALRMRIRELNALDLVLYETVRSGMYLPPATPAPIAPFARNGGWSRYDWPPPRDRDDPEVALTFVSGPRERRARAGDRVQFVVEVALQRPVRNLLLGIHIFDVYGNWAFGTNNELLQQSLGLGPGRYRAVFTVSASLPIGTYTAGFSTQERVSDSEVRPLVWYDRLNTFDVVSPVSMPFAGHSFLNPELRVEPVT
jgi:hypothetical protein